jgi:hypothetical protein
LPVPPKTSLPTTTPKLMPSATCHSGMSGGSVNANRIDVTKKPSLTSCPRTAANRISHAMPTAKVTM